MRLPFELLLPWIYSLHSPDVLIANLNLCYLPVHWQNKPRLAELELVIPFQMCAYQALYYYLYSIFVLV